MHLEQRPEPASDHRVVVDDQHRDGQRHRPSPGGTDPVMTDPVVTDPVVTGTVLTGAALTTTAALTGTVIRTTVPVFPDRMVSAAPAAAARSRIEASPRPPDGASGANPWPSSDTSRMTWRGVLARATRTPDAPACRSALCSASCATR